jgi:hypothetical protein
MKRFKCKECGYDIIGDEDSKPVCSNNHCNWPHNE